MIGAIQSHQPLQFIDGISAVIDPQIHKAIDPRPARRLPGDHQDGGRLFSADIPAFRLGGFQRGKQPVCQISFGILKRPGHCPPDGIFLHEIGLGGKALSHHVTGHLDAVLSGVCGASSLCVHHRHLTHVSVRIRRQQRLQGLRGGLSGAHQVQSQGAVTGFNNRLCCNGAHAGLGPWHHTANREPMRLHRHSQFTRGRIPSHDREGVNRTKGFVLPHSRLAETQAARDAYEQQSELQDVPHLKNFRHRSLLEDVRCRSESIGPKEPRQFLRPESRASVVIRHFSRLRTGFPLQALPNYCPSRSRVAASICDTTSSRAARALSIWGLTSAQFFCSIASLTPGMVFTP